MAGGTELATWSMATWPGARVGLRWREGLPEAPPPPRGRGKGSAWAFSGCGFADGQGLEPD